VSICTGTLKLPENVVRGFCGNGNYPGLLVPRTEEKRERSLELHLLVSSWLFQSVWNNIGQGLDVVAVKEEGWLPFFWGIRNGEMLRRPQLSRHGGITPWDSSV